MEPETVYGPDDGVYNGEKKDVIKYDLFRPAFSETCYKREDERGENYLEGINYLFLYISAHDV